MHVVVSDRDDRGNAVWRRIHHTESGRGVSQNLQPHGGNGALRPKTDSRRKYYIHLLISPAKFQFFFTQIFLVGNNMFLQNFYELYIKIPVYVLHIFFRKRKDMHWTQKWPMMQNRYGFFEPDELEFLEITCHENLLISWTVSLHSLN